MPITHQQIADRAAELDEQYLDVFNKAQKAAEAVVGKERESLRELCGGIGHVFKVSRFSLNPSKTRYCVFCGECEPKSGA